MSEKRTLHILFIRDDPDEAPVLDVFEEDEILGADEMLDALRLVHPTGAALYKTELTKTPGDGPDEAALPTLVGIL